MTNSLIRVYFSAVSHGLRESSGYAVFSYGSDPVDARRSIFRFLLGLAQRHASLPRLLYVLNYVLSCVAFIDGYDRPKQRQL